MSDAGPAAASAALSPESPSVLRSVLGVAGTAGGRVAVRSADGDVTYAALIDRARWVAWRLQQVGVGDGDVVGLCLERSADMVAAVLGTWLVGAAYLPLDPKLPQRRVSFMVDDAGVHAVLCHSSTAARLPDGVARVILDEGTDGGQRYVGDGPEAPDALAYVIYTSGSTGTPKGVRVGQRAVAALAAWIRSAFDRAETEEVLQSTSLSFDVSVFEILVALVNGGALHVVADVVVGLSSSTGPAPTLVSGVPSALRHLARTPGLRAARVVVSAGEPLDVPLAEALTAEHAVRLINAYGPTETTVFAAFAEISPDLVDGPVPIGGPLAGCRLYVVDEAGALTGVGVAGELCVGGAQVAAGYVNRPELTAERFVADPFVEGGGRMYRTGDRARWRADGLLEFLGRSDDQVKVRGYRIEPGEIEAVLRSHPKVADAVVVAFGGEDLRLVGYVVPVVGEETPSVVELRSHLGRSVPEYMVPSALMSLDSLPLTPNGKVDRAALPAPDAHRPEVGVPFASATSEAERVLVEIWKDVLDVDSVGIDDDFFALGGDSILSLQVVARAGKRGVRLTPKNIFENQTIRRMLEDHPPPSPGRSPEPVRSRGSSVPLSPVQREFLGHRLRLVEDFNQTVLLRLARDVPDGTVERAANAVAAAHSAFRLRYVKEEGVWSQRLDPTGTPSAFSSTTGGEAEAPAVARELRTQFNLNAGPLIGFGILRSTQATHLVITVNHLVIDAVSWHTLMTDLAEAVVAEEDGAFVQVTPVGSSFEEWVELLPERCRSEWLRTQRGYWESQSASLPLPVDFPDGENSAATVEHVVVAVGPDTTIALQRLLPRTRAIRTHEALLGTLALAVVRWTGRDAVSIEMEGHGRDLLDGEALDLSRTIGWFTSLFPLILAVRPEMSAAEAVGLTRRALHAVPDRGIGYQLLRHPPDARTPDPAFTSPLPELSFNFVGTFGSGAVELFDIVSDAVGPGTGAADPRPHVLDVNASILSDRLRVGWSYSSKLHRRSTVTDLAREHVRLLEELVTTLRQEA